MQLHPAPDLLLADLDGVWAVLVISLSAFAELMADITPMWAIPGSVASRVGMQMGSCSTHRKQRDASLRRGYQENKVRGTGHSCCEVVDRRDYPLLTTPSLILAKHWPAGARRSGWWWSFFPFPHAGAALLSSVHGFFLTTCISSHSWFCKFLRCFRGSWVTFVASKKMDQC